MCIMHFYMYMYVYNSVTVLFVCIVDDTHLKLAYGATQTGLFTGKALTTPSQSVPMH